MTTESQEYGSSAPKAARGRTLAVLLAAVLAGSAGDLLLSHGMKQVGAGLAPVEAALAALRTPAVVGGIACMAAYFALYLVALSWSDLSFALPITALSFVIVALFAQLVLHEHVSLLRWLGVGCIVAGVAYISRS